MNARKTVLVLSAGTMLAASLPTLADPPRWAPAYGYRDRHERAFAVERYRRPVVREVIVARPVVVRQPVYIERPPVVVREQPVYYSEAPAYGAAPVYYSTPARDPALGTLGGALVGAAIGSQVGHGDDRTAAIAVGAVLGGM